MKSVRATLVFVFRWLPIMAAAALIAWDFWGEAPIHRENDREMLAAAARDGRIHVVYVAVAGDRTIEGFTFNRERDSYRVKLSNNAAVSGPLIAQPPPLVSPSLGFQSDAFTTAATGTYFRRLVIPEWPIVLACVALPSSSLLFRQARRRRRKLMGQCVRCGHDLEGAPGSCPACGNVAPTIV